MSNVAKLKPDAPEAEVTGLALLRRPFPEHQVSKLPKETKKQAEQRKADQDKGNWPAKCGVCGGLHHPRAVHLDYVGHAAATDRLLDADPKWSWEPLAVTPQGLPALDQNGGLWIKLTVDGVTRIGYGSADGKTGGDAIKEIIGDALRNAGMRFGMALDLWHKGDLHLEESAEVEPVLSAEDRALKHIQNVGFDLNLLKDAWEKHRQQWREIMSDDAFARVKAEVERLAKAGKATPPSPEPPPKAQPAQTAQQRATSAFELDDEIPF